MTHEEMVQELWDREHLKELTYQYGLAIEAQDEEKMANLFTPDGSVDFSSMGRGVIQGTDAIKEFYPLNMASQGQTVFHESRPAHSRRHCEWHLFG